MINLKNLFLPFLSTKAKTDFVCKKHLKQKNEKEKKKTESV